MQGLSTAFPGPRAGLGGLYLPRHLQESRGPRASCYPALAFVRRLVPSGPGPVPQKQGTMARRGQTSRPTAAGEETPPGSRGPGVPGQESWSLAVRSRGGADGASSPEPSDPPRAIVTRRRGGVGWPGGGGSPLGLGDGAPHPAPRRPPGARARPRRPGPSGSAGGPGPPGPSSRRRLSPSRPLAQAPPPPARGRTHVDRVDVGSVEEVERSAQLQGWRDQVVPGLQLQVPMFGAERKELLAAQAAPRPR